jgi:YfiH family protein
MLGTHRPGPPGLAGHPGRTVGVRPLPGATPPLLTWPAFDPTSVQVVLTTRDGGVSTGSYASLNLGLHVGDDGAAVLTNRERAAAAMGVGLDELVFAEQVHQPTVTVVDASHRGRGARSASGALPATDALVTTTPGVVLVVMVADCVPLVLHDPVRGVLGCVHAGWGGTVRGVTPAAVLAMQGLGSDPADIVVGIGPCIDGAGYQVGGDVASAARDAFGDRADRVLRPDGTGRWLFDLVAAAGIQLTDAGVAADNIHPSGLTTGAHTPFFSHRAEGTCGRFAVLARLLDGASA